MWLERDPRYMYRIEEKNVLKNSSRVDEAQRFRIGSPFFFFWNSSVDEYSELRIIVGKRDENDKNVLYYTYSPTPLLVLLKNVSNVCTSTRREFCRKKKKKEGKKKRFVDDAILRFFVNCARNNFNSRLFFTCPSDTGLIRSHPPFFFLRSYIKYNRLYCYFEIKIRELGIESNYSLNERSFTLG